MFDYRGFIIIICLYCISCANIQGISGGPEDKKPPVLVEHNSSPNYQVNFKDKEIVLAFDEWIKMDNPFGNISISPPTEFPVEYKLKGKRVIIQFDEREQLKEKTTYTIQFGESIKDITSGNVQRTLRYVFSTGDFVDSLIIRGKVVDGFTKKSKDKILVSLYKLLDDTAFQKIKPFYFSWTDTAGRFVMENLSPGTYNLFALEDKNQNYFFDQTNEAFAFLPQSIEISDSSIQEFLLNVSTASIPLLIKDRKIKPGEIRFYFNAKLSRFKLNCDIHDSIKYVNLKDSLLVWNYGSHEANCILDYENKKDTFKVQSFELPLNDSIKIIRLDKTLLKPGEQPTFIMNYPIVNIIKDSLQLLDSFSMINNIKLDSSDPRIFHLSGDFPLNNQHKLVIQENAVQGLHHTTNQSDTFAFRYLDKSSLARLNLNIENLQLNLPYIFQLLNGEIVNAEFNFEATEPNKKMFFNNLYPGNYRVRLIYDINKNEKWDPADYVNKIQAEQIWYFDLPDLRADWDVDVSIKL